MARAKEKKKKNVEEDVAQAKKLVDDFRRWPEEVDGFLQRKNNNSRGR